MSGTTGATSAGKVLVDAIAQAGVRLVFGVPGESFLGILDACYEGPLRFISTRHEGGASFMASSYGKVSGEIAVCMGTRAVGTANLLIGVHNARQDSTPMLAVVGQVNRDFQGREAFQEVDLVAGLAPFCKWTVELDDPDRAGEIVARAIHLARSGRPGPVLLAVPQDVSSAPTSSGVLPLPTLAPPTPPPEAVRQLLDALWSASAPVIFAGGGLYRSAGAFERLIAFAEAAEVPVITSWRHHDGFPNDHRLFLGSASLGAAAPVFERLARADVVVALGNRMQENATQGYRLPAAGARLIQVDVDPSVMVNHRVPELAVVADAGETLAAALAALPDPVPGLSTRREANGADRRRFEEATRLPEALGEGKGVDYAAVVGALRRALPDDGVLATDGGNFFGWFSRYFRFHAPRTYIGPASGSMGYGLPGGIGAKLARPDLSVVSVSGDGGFLMTVAELETAVRYGVGVVAVVLDNARHGTIRMHQEREHPGRVVGTELSTPDLAALARAFGARGFDVTENDALGPTFSEALSGDGPAVVHVRMDRRQLSVDRVLDDGA